MSWKARLLWVFLGSIAFTALAAITAILYDDLSISDQILVSSLIFAAHSLGALIGAVLWQRKSPRRWVLPGVAVGVLGGLLWLAFVWLDEFDVITYRNDEYVIKPAASCTTIGLAMLARGLVCWPLGKAPWVIWLRRSAWVCGWIASGIILLAIWTHVDDDFMIKAMAILLILSTGSTVGVFIVDRLTQGDLVEHEDSALGMSMPVSLTCPRCGEACEVRANRKEACRACGLRLRVEFEEPRCACGYLLHGLTGGTCPECGSEIATEPDWSTSIAPTVARSGSDAPDQTPPT